MLNTLQRCCVTLAACALMLGCTARFSPATIREEIVRQRGVDPLSQFEMNLGRFTTYMLKNALTTDGGEVPFPGLREVQLSVYETPERDGPALDVTLFDVRGWEPVVRAREERRSFMILVRGTSRSNGSGEGSIGDLVVVGAGRSKVVYGRLQGKLNPKLPSRLGDLFDSDGPQGVVDVLSSLDGRSGR